MPKAQRGTLLPSLPPLPPLPPPNSPAVNPDSRKAGVLVECDPAIKAIILKIDQEANEYIVEDLDETHLLVKDTMVKRLKGRLDEELKNAVSYPDEEDESDRG